MYFQCLFMRFQRCPGGWPCHAWPQKRWRRGATGRKSNSKCLSLVSPCWVSAISVCNHRWSLHKRVMIYDQWFSLSVILHFVHPSLIMNNFPCFCVKFWIFFCIRLFFSGSPSSFTAWANQGLLNRLEYSGYRGNTKFLGIESLIDPHNFYMETC